MLMMYAALIDETSEQLRFEDIYYSYRKQMLYVAEQILGDRHDAEDAVQNAFLGIARNIKRVPQDDPRIIRAYVLTAAKNAALALVPRKQKRSHEAELSSLEADDTDVFERVMLCQDYHLLLKAMRQLSSPYREVLLLVYVHEHDTKAAAQILGRKEDTVRKQLSRGRRRLMELCRKEGLCFE